MSTDATEGAPEQQPTTTSALSQGPPTWAMVLIICAGIALLLGILAALVIPPLARVHEEALRRWCMSNVVAIGVSMKMYAGDHDGQFMNLVGSDGHTEPGVSAAGTISRLPSRSGFALLLKERYLTTTRVFVCPSSDDRAADEGFPSDFAEADLEDLVLREHNCSYGWDPTKRRSAHATCAIVADKPPAAGATAHNEGTVRNNSDNHDGDGQCVFYNDGHVKWATTSKPETGDDPDIYLGDPGYETSNTDAKIIR